MTRETIRIGTRGSNLALWQARETRARILEYIPDAKIEIIIIKTLGDTIIDLALSKIGNKGLFTSELEQALGEGKIDIAVHSLKDLPTALPDGLCLGAVLPRGEVRDVFISRDGIKLPDLKPGNKVGTSSLRRKSQILHHYPWVNVVDIRGNVDTRIQKMEQGYCDGLILAGAGVHRLGLTNKITSYLDPYIILPAVGQGAIAIQIRDNDTRTGEICSKINDSDTWKVTNAERAFLHALQGGCQVPVACYAVLNGTRVTITGLVADPSGAHTEQDSVECPLDNAPAEAELLAQKILNAGGKKILDNIRHKNER